MREKVGLAVATLAMAGAARLDLDGLREVLKLRGALEGQEDGTPPPPERYYDPGYHDAALALVAAGAAAPAVKPDGSMR